MWTKRGIVIRTIILFIVCVLVKKPPLYTPPESSLLVFLYDSAHFHQGARMLYKNHLQPFFTRHQARVDQIMGLTYVEMVIPVIIFSYSYSTMHLNSLCTCV